MNVYFAYDHQVRVNQKMTSNTKNIYWIKCSENVIDGINLLNLYYRDILENYNKSLVYLDHKTCHD